MIPRSGGEKVYLEAAYKRPKLLATIVFAVQAVLLGFTGQSSSVIILDVVLTWCSEWLYRLCVVCHRRFWQNSHGMGEARYRHSRHLLHYHRAHFLPQDWGQRHEFFRNPEDWRADIRGRDRMGKFESTPAPSRT